MMQFNTLFSMLQRGHYHCSSFLWKELRGVPNHQGGRLGGKTGDIRRLKLAFERPKRGAARGRRGHNTIRRKQTCLTGKGPVVVGVDNEGTGKKGVSGFCGKGVDRKLADRGLWPRGGGETTPGEIQLERARRVQGGDGGEKGGSVGELGGTFLIGRIDAAPVNASPLLLRERKGKLE